MVFKTLIRKKIVYSFCHNSLPPLLGIVQKGLIHIDSDNQQQCRWEQRLDVLHTSSLMVVSRQAEQVISGGGREVGSRKMLLERFRALCYSG